MTLPAVIVNNIPYSNISFINMHFYGNVKHSSFSISSIYMLDEWSQNSNISFGYEGSVTFAIVLVSVWVCVWMANL